MKILAIDDQNDNLISLKAIVNEIFPDSILFTALSGVKGIEIALEQDPDVILLDVVMPDMDGFEVCQRLKKDELIKEIPVIFFTAIKDCKENRIKALEVGAEAFLSKPVDEIELTAQIRAMAKIKAANVQKRNEKLRLASLIAERTQKLEKKQAEMSILLDNLHTENEIRKKSEAALRESENKFRTLVAKMQLGLAVHKIILDDKGHPVDYRFLDINPAFEKLTGLKNENVVGKTVLEVLPNTEKYWIEKYGQVVLTGEPVSFEDIAHELNKTFAVVAYKTRNYEFAVIIEDITERKLNETLLKESEEKFKAIFHNNAAAIAIMEPDTTISMVNEAYCNISGYKEHEIVGKSWTQTIPAEEIERLKEYNRRRLLNPKDAPEKYGFKFKTKNGDIRYGLISVSVIPSIKKIITSFVDITDRKQDEEIILLNEARLSRAEIVSKSGNWEFYVDEKKIIYSEGARRIYGIGKETNDYEQIKQIPLPEYRSIMDSALNDLIENNIPYNVEFKIKTIDNQEIKDIHSVATFNKEKRIIFGIIQDITENKKTENAIKLNEARLESLLRINQFQTENTQNLLNFALEEAIKLTGSEIGYLYFYDENRKEFTLNTWSGEVMQQCTVVDPQTVYSLEKTGIWGEAVRQRSPIMVNDFNATNPLKKGIPEGHVKLNRFLTIPVFSEEVIVAVIGVANKKDNYDEADIRQLNLMMDAVWKMVQNKKAEELLKASEEKFSKAFQNSPDVIIITSLADGKIIEVNESIFRMARYNREEIIGKSTIEMELWESNEGRNKFVEMLQKTGSVLNFETKFRKKSGEIFTGLISGEIIQFQDMKCVVSIIHDITFRKHQEDALKQKLNELERFNDLTVGREIKMIALKQEINQLLLKLGEKEKYKIAK